MRRMVIRKTGLGGIRERVVEGSRNDPNIV
jgi:hypothetical protein